MHDNVVTSEIVYDQMLVWRNPRLTKTLNTSKMNFVIFLICGAVAGWLAGLVMKGRGFGVLGNIIVGILGGLLGGFLFDTLGVALGSGIVNYILTAMIGAIVLLFLVGLIKKAK